MTFAKKNMKKDFLNIICFKAILKFILFGLKIMIT
jgi:hypothetical protein